MLDVNRSSLFRYGIAIVTAGLALLLTSMFTTLHTRVQFALFYLAVLISNLYGGRRAGLLATVLSAIASVYLLLLPSNTLAITLEGVLFVSIFVVVSLLLGWLTEKLKSAQVFAQESKAQLNLTLEQLKFQSLLLNVVEQAVIATDVDGKIVFWNQFAERLYGWKSEDVMGKDVIEIIPTDVSREKANEIMSQLQSGKSWSGEFLAQHKDGTVIPIRVRDSPVYDDKGKQIGIVGCSEDISKRIRADREKARLTLAIEEQRLRLDNIVASVPGVVWEAVGVPDASSQSIDFVSDYVETMLGYSVKEWLSTPNFWLQIVHDDDKERAAREAVAIFESGKGTSQFRWVAKDGRVLWVEAQSVAIYDDSGRAIGMRGVTMNITERARAEEMHSRLAAIVESSSDAIISKTLDGIITSWNQGAEQIYGYPAEEVLGKPISIIIPTDRANELAKILNKLKNKQRVERFETVRVRKDGTLVNIAVSISPIHNPHGKVIEASAIAHDITERKLAEERQAALLEREQSARSQAELANRTKDEFLATLSHELRTPLTAMLGWTWMLRYKLLDDETYARAVETIDRNMHVQANMIDDLLDVSRIINGNLRLEVRPTDLVAVIEAAIEAVRPAACAKEIHVNVKFEESAKCVTCDPARMQQVAWNLISNAVKFTPANGIVNVSLRRVENQMEINVSDSGRGIKADFLPFVFDRFRQADGSTTRTHGGLGLGLAIVRHLVELHGGTVSVESKGEGKGSNFTVSLPMVPVSVDQLNA